MILPCVIVEHWRALMKYEMTKVDLSSIAPDTLLIYGADSYDFDAKMSKKIGGSLPFPWEQLI
jgi:hypothetical protein